MNKKNNIKILKFPNNAAQVERKIEAILFAAEEPLDVETIEKRIGSSKDIKKNIAKTSRRILYKRNKFSFCFK